MAGYRLNPGSAPREGCFTNTTLQPGEECLDITGLPVEAQIWNDARSSGLDLWPVDQATLQVKRK